VRARVFWAELKRVSGVSIGACIVALSLNYFIVPNQITDGGVTGVAILLHYLLGMPTGALVLGLNIPVFLLGFRYMGGRFLILSMCGVLAVSAVLQFSAGALPVTHDLLLASIFGGLLSGVGMGIIFRAQGSLGGTDILALILKSRFSFSVGQILLIMDAVIFLIAGVIFKPESAMYAVIYVFFATKVVDFVLEGLNHSKAVFIISNKPEVVASDIIKILQRGVTYLYGSGAYSGENKKVIYCVVSRPELARIKEIVKEKDPAAFMAVSEAPEVFGEGFSPVRVR